MIDSAALRQYLQLPGDRATEVDKIASALIDKWERSTKRLWTRRVDHVEIVRPDGDRTRNLWLELWPIETITTVEERGCEDTDWTLVDPTDYWVVDDNHVGRISTWWRERVRVTYTAGYVATPAVGASPAQNATPEDVRDVLFLQARFNLARQTSDKLLVSGQAFEAGTVSYVDADVHPRFKRAAADYVRKA